MTEKRFTFADGFKIVAIKDNDKIMNSKQVCNKLNELYEENEQLIQENKELKKKLESKQRLINAYDNYIKTLKEDGILDD